MHSVKKIKFYQMQNGDRQNREKANLASALHHQKNRDARNLKRREKRAREKAQRIQVVIEPTAEIVSV